LQLHRAGLATRQLDERGTKGERRRKPSLEEEKEKPREERESGAGRRYGKTARQLRDDFFPDVFYFLRPVHSSAAKSKAIPGSPNTAGVGATDRRVLEDGRRRRVRRKTEEEHKGSQARR